MPTVSPSRVPVKLKYLILDENGKTYKATNLSEVNRMKRVLKNQGVKFKVTKLPKGSTTWNTNPYNSDFGQQAWEAGKRWASQAGDSGVANARVVHYGFVKWWNNLSPATTHGIKKSSAEKDFRAGYKIGKGKNPRNTGTTVPAHVRINPRTGRIQVFVTPKVAEKLRGGKGLRVAGNPTKRELSIPEKHQLAIAIKTLKYPDAIASVMGGPTKAQAREIILRLTGKPSKY